MRHNKQSHYAELRQQVKFKIRAVEPGQVDYLPGYYSVVSTASLRGLKGKYTVALVSESHRQQYMQQNNFQDEMKAFALRELIKTVRAERIRL